MNAIIPNKPIYDRAADRRAALAPHVSPERFTICRVIGPEALQVVSRHSTQDEAEIAMLALGERYPCGGENHVLLVEGGGE